MAPHRFRLVQQDCNPVAFVRSRLHAAIVNLHNQKALGDGACRALPLERRVRNAKPIGPERPSGLQDLLVPFTIKLASCYGSVCLWERTASRFVYTKSMTNSCRTV